jgi:CubicO group peptidase (beta-lactamase class C family)
MRPLSVGKQSWASAHPRSIRIDKLPRFCEQSPSSGGSWAWERVGAWSTTSSGAAPPAWSAGSLAWAGRANTYFWIDRTKRVAGVFLSQVIPFYDDTAIELFGKFETEV